MNTVHATGHGSMFAAYSVGDRPMSENEHDARERARQLDRGNFALLRAINRNVEREIAFDATHPTHFTGHHDSLIG